MTTIDGTNNTKKEKLQRALGSTVCGELEAKDADSLRAYLASLGLHEQEVDDAEEQDAALREAKERVAELRGPYADARKGITQRRKYTSILLAETGAAPVDDLGGEA